MVTPPQRPGGKKTAQRPIITPRDQQKASHSTGMFASDDIEETDSIDFFRREEESEKNDILDNEFNQPLVIDSGENEVKRPISSSMVQRQPQSLEIQPSSEIGETKDESIYYDHPELDDEIDESLLVSSDQESESISYEEDRSDTYLSEDDEEYNEPKDKKPNFITKFMGEKLAQVKTYFSIQRIIGLILVAALFGFGIYKLYPVVSGFLGAPNSNLLSRQAGDIIDNAGGVTGSDYEKYEMPQIGLGTYMPEGLILASGEEGEEKSFPEAMYSLYNLEDEADIAVYASPNLYELSSNEIDNNLPENYMLVLFMKIDELETTGETPLEHLENLVESSDGKAALVDFPEINDSKGVITKDESGSITLDTETSGDTTYSALILDDDGFYIAVTMSSNSQFSQNALDRLYSLNN